MSDLTWQPPGQPQFQRKIVANVVYEGWAQAGAADDAAAWQIRRIAFGAQGQTQVDWAGIGRLASVHAFRWDIADTAPFPRPVSFTPVAPPSPSEGDSGGSYLPSGW
jgi:hypothetical protein